MRTLERDFDASRAPVQRPVSGQYCGDSAEDDQGDQAVVSNLKFGADGSITGDGIDGVDGIYARRAAGPADRCAWIERYGDGFEVAVDWHGWRAEWRHLHPVLLVARHFWVRGPQAADGRVTDSCVFSSRQCLRQRDLRHCMLRSSPTHYADLYYTADSRPHAVDATTTWRQQVADRARVF